MCTTHTSTKLHRLSSFHLVPFTAAVHKHTHNYIKLMTKMCSKTDVLSVLIYFFLLLLSIFLVYCMTSFSWILYSKNNDFAVYPLLSFRKCCRREQRKPYALCIRIRSMILVHCVIQIFCWIIQQSIVSKKRVHAVMPGFKNI